MTSLEMIKLAEERGINLSTEEGKTWAESVKALCEAQKAEEEAALVKKSGFMVKFKNAAESVCPVIGLGLQGVSVWLNNKLHKETVGQCLAIENTGKLSQGCDKVISRAFADTTKSIENLRSK